MRIRRASESFLRENAEFAGAYLPEILESYKSFADFLKHGFAFFALEGENICGNIISNGEYNGCFIVGADTKAEYRRRGIASALLRTAIESARERGNEIIWECAEENIPSVRTAESCGMHRCGEFSSAGLNSNRKLRKINQIVSTACEIEFSKTNIGAVVRAALLIYF